MPEKIPEKIPEGPDEEEIPPDPEQPLGSVKPQPLVPFLEEEQPIALMRSIDINIAKPLQLEGFEIVRIPGEHVIDIRDDTFMFIKGWSEKINTKRAAYREQGGKQQGQLLTDAAFIIGFIYSMLFKDPESLKTDDILLCKDRNNEVQAIAIINKNGTRLEFFATHPDNILVDFPLNVPDEQVPHVPVRGAGTAIMVYLIEQVVRTRSSIALMPLESAIPFYKKFEFTPKEEGRIVTKWHLTAARVTELCSGTYLFI